MSPPIKHGYYRRGRKHLLLSTWERMHKRCQDPKHRSWKNYGGRGITVCERWKSFANFVDDMGPKYQSGLTLERLNNDAGYSPDNCCWATRFQQARNRRTNVMIDGMCLKDAALKAGIPPNRLWARIRAGWPKADWFIPERKSKWFHHTS